MDVDWPGCWVLFCFVYYSISVRNVVSFPFWFSPSRWPAGEVGFLPPAHRRWFFLTPPLSLLGVSCQDPLLWSCAIHPPHPPTSLCFDSLGSGISFPSFSSPRNISERVSAPCSDADTFHLSGLLLALGCSREALRLWVCQDRPR